MADCNDTHTSTNSDCVQNSLLTSPLNALNAKHSVSPSSDSVPLCSCHICKKLEHESVLSLWQQLKIAVLRVYSDSGLHLSHNFLQQSKIELPPPHSKPPIPNSDHLKELVHRLIVHDLHKLHQCLEAQIRLFVVEIRLSLLKHIKQGSHALLEALIEFYTKLGRASKKSGQFLQELESRHLRKYNLTWELVNRRLFQSIVYCDVYIKHTLLKLKTLTDDRNFIEMYTKFIKFEDEMTVISVVWREAQEHSDDYEKYAILRKKKQMIKEWEQCSLELVGQTGKGKQNETMSPCFWKKKPSIECVNRGVFVEEPKRLKSGKNLQTVNIPVEVQATLQEQVLLANYGEWDSIDNKMLSTACSYSSSHCKSEKHSASIDVLVNSKSDTNDVSDNEEEDDDDDGMDEDDEDGDDEEEDEDDEDDESCSDQSSTTSTSTSNNQRGDGGRVCDCCYCEVFGHGMPAVAPTSRNFNEMRERLRMRLSKRKAEKGCENGNTNVAGVSIKKKDNIEVEDNRDLEELINFINGTNDEMKESKSKKKKEKQKKKKDKQKDKPLHTNEVPSTLVAEDSKSKSLDEFSCRSNKENSKPTEPVKVNGELNHSKAKNGSTKRKTAIGNEKRKSADTGERFEMNTNGDQFREEQHQAAHILTHSTHATVPGHVCNGIGSMSNKKLQQNLMKEYQKCCEPGLLSPEKMNGEVTVKLKSKEKNIKTKGKKKNAADEALSPDDVFKPKDIDLENGELDEFEKELEAFKRFCYNSKPLARKEKVNVNLKDIVIKKKQTFADENDVCLRK